jgi:hypothetical protein
VENTSYLYVIFPALDPDIVTGTSSDILILYSYLRMRDQIAHPCKTTDKFKDLCISVLNICKHTISVLSVMM